MIPILMITYNGLSLTKAAVQSVLAQDVETHLFIIDNASTDGTREYLHTLDPERATTIMFARNFGVSKAWNIGLRWLFDTQRQEAVLVVNNDVMLRPDTVRVLMEDGGEFVTAVGVNSLAESLSELTLSHRPNPDFSCFLIRRSAWMRVGEFDQRFFAWFGDGDYHVRLTKAGIWAGTCGIPFYHIAAATVKSSQSKDERNKWKDLFEADRRAFSEKWKFLPGSKEYEKATTLEEITC